MDLDIFFFCECLFISYKTTITQCLLTVTQYPKSNNNTKLNLLTHLLTTVKYPKSNNTMQQ